jgi:hypothetical protein
MPIRITPERGHDHDHDGYAAEQEFTRDDAPGGGVLLDRQRRAERRVDVAAHQRVDDVEKGEEQARTTAAANRSVAGTPTTGPMTISMIDGGINMPSVPPAVMAPALRRTS